MDQLIDAAWLTRELSERPDATDVDAAASAPRLWRRIEVVAETGSTNAVLAERARQGEPSGAVLVANHQTSGRGRFTRVWQAPPGKAVALSVLVRPRISDPRRWLWLPLLAGLAVADGLRTAAAVDARLKWPNDVLINGRKVCGILAERVEGPEPAVVIGMGVNTLLNQDELPVPTATSLALAGAEVVPHRIVRDILRSFEKWYLGWDAGADLREPYRACCDTLGRQVRVVVSETDAVEGEAIGVDPDGCLQVRTPDGVRSFAAGDVWHLR